MSPSSHGPGPPAARRLPLSGGPRRLRAPRVLAFGGRPLALIAVISIAAAAAGGAAVGSGGAPPNAGRPLAPVTRHDGCRRRGALPDPACTPGAVLTSDLARICRRGYTRTVRRVDYALKRRIYRSYGVARHPRGSYEIDHLVPLELGGGNDPANLWPEPASPKPGFHEKDSLENQLHDRVCHRRLSIARAQRQIATDWPSAWRAGQP